MLSSASPQRLTQLACITTIYLHTPDSLKMQLQMSLATLPTELLELISSHLRLPSFASLRLSCRHCYIRTLLLFKDRFFGTQYVSWNKVSLQKLVDIAAHRELGDALRHLVINSTPHHALSLWKISRRSADAGHLTPLTDDEDGAKLVHRLDSQFQILQEEAERSARWFNETRFDVSCLKKAFERVKGLESPVFAYEGMEIRYSKFAQRYCEASQHEMSRPFVSTLSALAASGTLVKRIEMAKGKTHGAVSVGRLESLAPHMRVFGKLFEGLQVLELNLRDRRRPDEGFELENGRAPQGLRFLARCKSVRVLDLSFYSTLKEDVFGELLRECRFERLERVTLEFCRVRQGSDLLKFFEPSKRCLKEVTLKDVMLDEYNKRERGWKTWKQILDGFADDKMLFEKLQVFHAERMISESRIGARRLLFKREGLKSLLHLEGEHWRDELREYAETCLDSAGGKLWETVAITYPFTKSDSM